MTNKHIIAGIASYKDEKFHIAVEHFTLAVKDEPENADFHEHLAMAYFHGGNKEKSLVHLNYAQTIEPKNPFRYSSRAYIKDSLGDTQGAVDDYKIAIEIDPHDAVAHNNLGLLEEKLGYKAQAKHTHKRADELAEEFGFGPEMKADTPPPNGQPKNGATNGNSQNGSQNDAAKAAPKVSLPEEQVEENGSLWNVIGQVFTSSSHRKEFFQFLKNGFRIK